MTFFTDFIILINFNILIKYFKDCIASYPRFNIKERKKITESRLTSLANLNSQEHGQLQHHL